MNQGNEDMKKQTGKMWPHPDDPYEALGYGFLVLTVTISNICSPEPIGYDQNMAKKWIEQICWECRN